MDAGLLEVVLERMAGDGRLSTAATDLLLAACQGDAALAAVLGGEPPDHPDGPAGRAPAPVGAFLASITVEGFRGVGPEATLALHPGPGLTVVVGRNGSGKSSFAEGLEVLLTGTTDRFGRRAAFRQGWRNLHRPTGARVAAELHVAGEPGATRVERWWADGAELADGTATVQVAGERVAGLDRLGWGDALTTYRPFLAHTEVEAMLGSPSGLYDRLASVLGLEDLTAAQDRLDRERKVLDAAAKDAEAERKRLVAVLAGIDDERARAAVAALEKRSPDLAAVERLATGATPAQAGGELDRLRCLALLESPPAPALEAAAERLRAAAGELDAVAGTEAARARSVADLLARALDHRDAHAGHAAGGEGAGAAVPCPVCGQADALDEAWAAQAADELARLRAESDQAERAHKEARAALDEGLALVRPLPRAVGDGDGDPAGQARAELVAAWGAWGSPPAADAGEAPSLRRLADHVATGTRLGDLVAPVRRAAADELAARDDRWSPRAGEVATWVRRARSTEVAKPLRKELKAAGAWLKAAHDDIRNDRLRPIAEEAQAVWALLRHESNVSLGVMRLTGSRTQRRVDLAAQVDGSDGDALGVMSQGEVNALALSVFLPRATLAGSPFRFVVIDDPVQAMDPAKVEGLARVLHRAAESRQVVVFTHDDRLPAAVRRLALPARIVQVQRRRRSVVEVAPASDPAGQALRDARSVAKSQKTPDAVRRRVVPGLCRLALEATLTALVQQRQHARGRPHDQVEADLVAAQTLNRKAALALFDDLDAAGRVLGALAAIAPEHATTFKALKEGAHGGCVGDPLTTVEATGRLIDALANRAGRPGAARP